MSEVLLVSGGIDSTVMMYNEALTNHAEIYTLYVDYGQRNPIGEQDALVKILADLGKKLGHRVDHNLLDISYAGELFNSGLTQEDMPLPDHEEYMLHDDSTIVPLRNTLMISLAVAYADTLDCDKVLIGSHKGGETFVRWMSKLVRVSNDRGITLETPFIQMDKKDIVHLGMKLDAPLELTHTCYLNEICGKCAGCYSRNKVIII